jgi:hypothetical protein
MANLGTIATARLTRANLVSPGATSSRIFLRGQTYMVAPTGRDNTFGNPTPALQVARFGFYPVRIAVSAGARTLSVDVLQPEAAAERPFVRIRRNADIGLLADVEAVAGYSETWQTLTANFDASENGGVLVELWNGSPADACWWDNLLVQ